MEMVSFVLAMFIEGRVAPGFILPDPVVAKVPSWISASIFFFISARVHP